MWLTDIFYLVLVFWVWSTKLTLGSPYRFLLEVWKTEASGILSQLHHLQKIQIPEPRLNLLN